MSKKRLLKNGYYIIKNEKKEKETKVTIEISSVDIRFFRYRSINDNTLKALLNHEFWASQPSTFNDPYDMFITYDRKKIFDKFFEKTKEQQEENDDINIDDFEPGFSEFMTNTMKKSQYVACFSEKVDNPAMWAHYSQNGTGFALEYNFEQIDNIRFHYYESYLQPIFEDLLGEIKEEHFKKLIKLHTFFLPVFYSSRTGDYTKTFLTYVDKYDEMFLHSTPEESRKFLLDFLDTDNYLDEKSMMETIAITKNSYWKYEKEWRLVVSSFDFINSHKQLNYTMPIGIYLGEFITKANKILLCSIAHRNDIPIYQMITRHTKKTNKLAYKKISEKELKIILNL